MSMNIVILSMIILCNIGCISVPPNQDAKNISCGYDGIREVALGINGYAVQHYVITNNDEIEQVIFQWLDSHREGWRECEFTIPANIFISGDLFQVNINDNHIGILWTNDVREKYRWYYRALDNEVTNLLEEIKNWQIGLNNKKIISIGSI